MYGLTDTTDTGKTPAQVAAEKRKNDKTDEKRKLGTQARHEMQAVQGGAVTPPQAAPPPPPNATPAPPLAREPVPQIAPSTAPVPHETPPTFTPAKYEPPKKGLEYLAMGLGLLFPGAPIATAAAGFAQGLGQGAQNSYQRREKDAEQQYKAAQDKAKADADNAAAVKLAEDQKRKDDLTNAQMRYQAQGERDQQLRDQDIDPLTNRQFIKPPELARPIPPPDNICEPSLNIRELSELDQRTIGPKEEDQRKGPNEIRAREFAEFFGAYPHQVGEAEARQAYDVAREKHEAETILSGLRRYAASKPKDREWLNPANFLAKGRFLDKPALAYSGLSPSEAEMLVPIGKFLAKVGSDQWNAWAGYRRRNGGTSMPISDKTGGWYVDSEYPPGFTPSPTHEQPERTMRHE